MFILAGMGGGTGGGASPIVAEIAAEQGALVIAFVTLPFSFEGGRRLKQAEEGLAALRRACDAVIPLPNDILLQEGADNETVLDSFARADEWIGRGVKSIWAMLSKTGLINVDFATLRQAFQQRGAKTLFGLARGRGRECGRRRDREPQALPAPAHAGVFPQGGPPARQHHRRHRPDAPEGQRDHERHRRAVRPGLAHHHGRRDRRGDAGEGRDLRPRDERHGNPGRSAEAAGPDPLPPAGAAPGRAGPRYLRSRRQPKSRSRRARSRCRTNSGSARWRAGGSSSGPTAISSTARTSTFRPTSERASR